MFLQHVLKVLEWVWNLVRNKYSWKIENCLIVAPAQELRFVLKKAQQKTLIFNFFIFQDPYPVFMHISDIEGEYIPRKGDKVQYQVCPMPPRFDKPQGVHIKIIDFTPELHKKWSEKETAEELQEDAEAIQEEKAMTEKLKGTKVSLFD